MMRPRRPLFLARRSYRLHRVQDATRLLPIFGAFLFTLLTLWPPDPATPRHLSQDAVYLFAVWLLLIVAAALLSRRLSGQIPPDDPAGTDEE
jgi:hypothetical protein